MIMMMSSEQAFKSSPMNNNYFEADIENLNPDKIKSPQKLSENPTEEKMSKKKKKKDKKKKEKKDKKDKRKSKKTKKR